ncbi:hypothetical protein [Chitinophaga sp.]|uniref:hypothetical protein n=1 Tax=Chitinophaga sp. TaxID=1869181 RepID=UPI00260D7A4C|nr:hypothetical protein [uncultured Chitinophaga sp.]
MMKRSSSARDQKNATWKCRAEGGIGSCITAGDGKRTYSMALPKAVEATTTTEGREGILPAGRYPVTGASTITSHVYNIIPAGRQCLARGASAAIRGEARFPLEGSAVSGARTGHLQDINALRNVLAPHKGRWSAFLEDAAGTMIRKSLFLNITVTSL